MPRKGRISKTIKVGKNLVDTGTGEILDELFEGLPHPNSLDKTKPLTDEQYALIAKLPDSEKARYMDGFKNTAEWAQEDIERHYQAAHFGEVRYHSSGGGGKGSPTPPTSRR
jgi:hypothetical protein